MILTQICAEKQMAHCLCFLFWQLPAGGAPAGRQSAGEASGRSPPWLAIALPNREHEIRRVLSHKLFARVIPL